MTLSSESVITARHSRRQPVQAALVSILVVLVLAILWFAALGYRDLNEPDEGRYAEIPREMVVSGDWVTPRLNGFKYFEKPPLQYWTTAVSYDLFGQSNMSARLWPALLGFLTVLWVGFVGWRLFDRRAGLFAASMLSSGLLWVAFGHINTLDMGVSAFLAFGMGALALAQACRDKPTACRNWMLLGWAMLAGAVLSKGLIGLVLPGGAMVLYSLWQRDWIIWRHMHFGKGVLLFLVLTAPWFIAVSRANPDFLWFFFVHEHFLRYFTTEADRVQPWWYFAAWVWVGFLPWFGSGLRAIVQPGFHWWGSDGRFDPTRLFWVYGVFVLVFFSLSDSKLIPYILPAYPAFAWIAGHGLARRGLLRFDVGVTGVLGCVFLILAFNLHWFAKDDLPLSILVGCRPWLLAAGGVMLGGAILVWCLRESKLRIVGLAFVALLGLQLINWGYQALSPVYSGRAMARAMAPLTKPDVPIYSVDQYEQTLPFYLGRTLRLVDYQGEMAFGIKRAPDAWVPDLATFTTLWRGDDKALAVMSIDDYNKFSAEKLPMHVVYRGPRRVVVARQ